MKRFWKSGDPYVWWTGGALAFSLLMVVGLLSVILVNGLGCFWPSEVERFTLADGRSVLGMVTDREEVPGTGGAQRVQVRQGNRDLYGVDFVWIDESAIQRREKPSNAAVIERREWGLLIGVVEEVRDGAAVIGKGDEAWAELEKRLPEARKRWETVQAIEKGELVDVAREQEGLRLERRRIELSGNAGAAELERIDAEIEECRKGYAEGQKRLAEAKARLTTRVVVRADGGDSKTLPLEQLVRVHRPNGMGTGAKCGLYLSRLWEFLSDDPRESNTEGGILPAIFGTVLMVLLMSLAVTPLGVLAAFYLREYAKQGPIVSAVRIAVNNLAGVPSIVFGVFGVGFFVYLVGGTIDGLFFPEALPAPTYGTGGILWASLTLALLTVPVVIVATEEGLASIPPSMREGALALGATKFETTWKVVLPSVAPSILTGLILAMARAAGEVAPLMITGVVKMAPTLAVDGQAPFFHPERKFMHLGFHIYDVGFQSPNVEAARPMVFMTTILLLGIVFALNFVAIALRRRLRARLVNLAL
ncbi:MAG: phosphate ABC transporter permease PstA [Planctomycetota bacterium]